MFIGLVWFTCFAPWQNDGRISRTYHLGECVFPINVGHFVYVFIEIIVGLQLSFAVCSFDCSLFYWREQVVP